MRIPGSINYNTYLAYKPNQDIIEPFRKIKAENFEWDVNHPKTLVSLCIEQLSENWTGYPKLEQLIAKDREFFLQILNTDVPLSVLVDNIKSDIYWKRCYSSKWSDMPLTNGTKKWINIFMERYFSDILENMNPRNYDPEKVTALVKLCGPYIQSLSIRSLIPADIPVQRMTSPEMADLVTSQRLNGHKPQIKNGEVLSRDHISLHAAIGSLSNLIELHITYQLRFIGVDYRRDQFQFTNNDAKNLARGLEKCSQLKILRITRSDMNCQRVKYILRGLCNSEFLEILDFSHCKIGDDGASSIAKFITKRDNLRTVILVDNIFGPAGAENISHALNHTSCAIRSLDLRLNSKLGSEGVAYIAVSLARGCNLTHLNLSGCGIKPGPLAKAPSGVWSVTSAESPPTCGELLARAIGLVKTPLRFLDISVNDIGSVIYLCATSVNFTNEHEKISISASLIWFSTCSNFQPSDSILSNAICLSYIVDLNLKRSGMSCMAVAIAEAAAASQRLRREAERGIRFRRSASRVLQARRVVRGMNIDADPMLLAQQLSARPSIVSVASEEGMYSMQTQPLPSDFSFVPAFKIPLPSSQASSITGPPTSRRSSHHMILEPVKEVRKTVLVRRGSDGSLLQPRDSSQKHIKIFVS